MSSATTDMSFKYAVTAPKGYIVKNTFEMKNKIIHKLPPCLHGYSTETLSREADVNSKATMN